MTRKILYITGTRADYGLMHETLELLNDNENIQLSIVATGMHLMEEFGYSINEVKKVKVLVFRLHQTLCDPMNCSPPGSSVCGVPQARIPEWVAISSPWAPPGHRAAKPVRHNY